MIRLAESDYRTLLEPLRAVPFNTYFVRAVLAGRAGGRVFADSAAAPGSFYVCHDYGMSLLFGDGNDLFFDELFGASARPRAKDEWLQAYPRAWDAKLNKLVETGRASLHVRINYSFNEAAYRSNKRQIRTGIYTVVPTSEELFQTLEGSVVPKAFWRDGRLFAGASAGFTVLAGDEPASTAFGACCQDGALEIGIETAEKYRGGGLARAACAALIDHCLARGLEPVWACRAGNAGSENLAKSLGFREVRRLPFYRISY
jgi:RimJ/RimL family protein N-acetyltransferase